MSVIKHYCMLDSFLKLLHLEYGTQFKSIIKQTPIVWNLLPA